MEADINGQFLLANIENDDKQSSQELMKTAMEMESKYKTIDGGRGRL